MENLVFTQLSIPEVRQLFREEIESFFASRAFQRQSEDDDIGGLELAREITGYTDKTIYGLTSRRQIPHLKRGKKLFFSRKELTDWIRSGKRKTREELSAAVAA